MNRRAFLTGSLATAGIVAFAPPANGVLANWQATPGADDDFPLLELGLKDDGFVVPENIAAGRHHVVVTNHGTSDASHFGFGHIPDQVTDEQYQAWLDGHGEDTADLSFDVIEFVGVPDWPKAGKSVSGVIDLVPGSYFLFDPFDARGFAMVTVAGQVTTAPEPKSDLTVTLKDMTIELPETAFTTDPMRWKIENVGGISHEVAVIPVIEEFTEEDLKILFSLPEDGTPPAGVDNLDYEPLTAIGILAKGHTSWLDVQLPQGHYLAACMLPFGTGYPHAVDGMYRFFEVK